MIDWEFAHVGDPVDDIAWFVYRAGGRSAAVSADRIADLLARYEGAAGYRVDPMSLAYYRVFVQVRCAVTTAMTIARGGGAMGLSGYRVAHRRFIRESLQSIADATGSVIRRPDPIPRVATSSTPLFDEALGEVRDSLIASLRGEQKLHARSLETLIAHLRTRDLIGVDVDAANERDLEEALTAGGSVGSANAEGLCRILREAGSTADPSMLGCLLRAAIRNEWLWMSNGLEAS